MVGTRSVSLEKRNITVSYFLGSGICAIGNCGSGNSGSGTGGTDNALVWRKEEVLYRIRSKVGVSREKYRSVLLD